jgi:hypothetical protein
LFTDAEDCRHGGFDQIQNSASQGLGDKFIPDTVVFKVAAQYIRFCGALVHSSFVVSGFVYRVIFFGRKFCDEAWKAARRPKTKRGTMRFSRCFYSQAEPLVAHFSAVLDDHTYQTQLDMLRDCEVKSIELFSILAYLASDDRVALLPKSGAGNCHFDNFARFCAVFTISFDVVQGYETRIWGLSTCLFAEWSNCLRHYKIPRRLK